MRRRTTRHNNTRQTMKTYNNLEPSIICAIPIMIIASKIIVILRRNNKVSCMGRIYIF